MKEEPLEKNVELKCMKVNVLKRLRQIEGCCDIQDGVLCDNSYRLPAVNYYHKALHLGCGSSPRSASEIVDFAFNVI